ncbi:MAG: rhodanese-like domain-containing protein [Phycisphaerales bacterium JB047]
MLMRMIYDEKLAQAAYLIGCQQSGEAIVFDPERDVDRYIDLAATHDLEIVAVAETHIHADFVSGSRELAERVGAKVYLSDEGGEDWQYQWLDKKSDAGSYEHQLLKDGDSFKVGKIEFTAVHTPGHTPEHMAYLVTDHGSGATEPIGMISGDFVFVGDLGRPDLLETAAGQAGAMEPSARTLFTTLQRLEGLPDFVQVWPAHGAGSACGKALGAVPTSTVGYEKRFNPAILAGRDEQRFIDFILSGQPEPPLYFANMKRDNKIGPPVLGGLPTPKQMSPTELTTLDARTVALLDVRDWDTYRAGHLPGAMSFEMGNSFNTDVGSMVRDEEDIYLIIDSNLLEEAVRDLIRIGLDRIKGWCPADEFTKHPPTELIKIDEVDVQRAHELIDSGKVCVVDVRRATEFREGHIPDAVNIAHTRLASRMSEVPSEGPLLINCRSGKRSARASGYLQRAGFETINLEGGYLAWESANEPAAS